MHGPKLRQLAAQRREIVTALTRQAAELADDAGRPGARRR
jgi:hypothetical protein